MVRQAQDGSVERNLQRCASEDASQSCWVIQSYLPGETNDARTSDHTLGRVTSFLAVTKPQN